MGYRYEVRLSGAGGQGLVLAGVILGEAACLFDGKNAVQSQSYGPEARGGASKSEVIISDEPIDYPKATSIDLFLALTREAYDKYKGDLKPGATAVADSGLGCELGEGENFKLYNLPILESTREKIGKIFVANIVALGAIARLTGVVRLESLEKAVLDRVPKGTEELNKRALSLGISLAEKALEERGG